MDENIINNEIETLLDIMHDYVYKRQYYKGTDENLFNHYNNELNRVINRLSFLYLYKSFDYLKN